MIKKIWFTDGIACQFYDGIKSLLEPWIEVQLPKYELSHIGIKEPRDGLRREEYEEIVIILHFNPKGKYNWKPTLNEINAPSYLKDNSHD